MSSDFAIKIDNLSKHYSVYKNPKDRIKEFFSNKKYHQNFWALKSISLSVNRGEVLGIIGKNGSGKSTLLKIVSNILTPSSGKIEVNGHVSPILELGMGFDPNLSGIENIYLSATLLGIKKTDIDNKLYEIIDFSELGEFVEQPVKTYSSGMYVRLAFSIATTIDPDILVVDEALSVGDSYFQKKSLNRILEFKSMGKTILFCSHNMYQITHLCDRAAWIDKGELRMVGNSLEVTECFEEMMFKQSMRLKDKESEIEHNKLVYIKKLEINHNNIKPKDSLIIKMNFNNSNKLPFHLAIAIENNENLVICSASTYHDGLSPVCKEDGSVEFEIPSVPFLSGKYNVNFAILDESATITYDCKFLSFDVIKDTNLVGIINVDHVWRNYD